MAARASKTVGGRLDGLAASFAQQGIRFTELRRSVLALILAADGPVTAYELLNRLQETRRNAAPPTVYRSLEFLLTQRLIHRVERLNAYIGCTDAAGHRHPVQFLICRSCGTVNELEDRAIMGALDKATTRKGFRTAQVTIEVEGICAACSRDRRPGA
jgi:Fur family transcriptional regulator, zinc uptake regulator